MIHSSQPWHNLFLLFSFHKHTVFPIVRTAVNLVVLELSTPFFDRSGPPLVLRDYHAHGPWYFLASAPQEVSSDSLKVGCQTALFSLNFSDSPHSKQTFLWEVAGLVLQKQDPPLTRLLQLSPVLLGHMEPSYFHHRISLWHFGDGMPWWGGATCMPSRFSRVWLFVNLWIVACQAPLSMGFSRQEYWSELPLPTPEIPRGYS